MLWKFRRGFILFLLLLVGLILLKLDFHFPRPSLRRAVESFPAQSPETLLKDNEHLRALLGLSRGSYAKFVPCRIVGISPWVYPSVVTLDRGSLAGVEAGMSIVSGKGCLIGRVTEVTERSASGITLFHPENKVSVVISSTGELGILEGGSFPYLRVKFLPPNCRAVSGDDVRTSSMTQLFPLRIPVGRLVRVSGSANELAMQGFIQPYFYYDSFEDVAVVK